VIQLKHQLDRTQTQGSSLTHRDHPSMSVAFLECSAFKEFLPHDHVCCSSCHESRARLIYVKPLQENGNPDWFLCIEGIVCCKAYDLVRAIPHSWWADRSQELGVKREDQRGYVYPQSPEHDTDRERPKPGKRVPVRQSRKTAVEEDEEFSYDDYINDL